MVKHTDVKNCDQNTEVAILCQLARDHLNLLVFTRIPNSVIQNCSFQAGTIKKSRLMVNRVIENHKCS